MSASRRVSSLKRIRYLLFAVFALYFAHLITPLLVDSCWAKLPPPVFQPDPQDGRGDEFDNVAPPDLPEPVPWEGRTVPIGQIADIHPRVNLQDELTWQEISHVILACLLKPLR